MSLDPAHRFKLARRTWTVTVHPPLDPFLNPSEGWAALFDIVCACVTEPDEFRAAVLDSRAYIPVEQLKDIANWCVELVCERNADYAAEVWQYGRANRILVEGRIAPRPLSALSARTFYALVYNLMCDEAGSRSNLEKQLNQWVIDARLLQAARQSGHEQAGEHEMSWDHADQLAMALLKAD